MADHVEIEGGWEVPPMRHPPSHKICICTCPNNQILVHVSLFHSLPLSLFLFISLIYFLFSHTKSPAPSNSLHLSLSPFLTLCIFPFLSFINLSLSLSLSHAHSLTRSDSLHLCHSRTTRAQHHHTEQQRTWVILRRISHNPQSCAHNSTTSTHRMTEDPRQPA